MAKNMSYEHFKLLMKIFEVGTKNGHNWVENRFSRVGMDGKCNAKLEECENNHLNARNGQKTWKHRKFHVRFRAYHYELLQ